MAEKAVDTTQAKDLAKQFLKRLVDDFRFGNDVETMDQVINGLLPRDDEGNTRFDDAARAQAAKTLITGLDALKKDGDIADQAKTRIQDIFNDPAIKSARELAVQIKDRVRTQEFLTLLNANNADFGFNYNREQLGYIQALWNGLSPGLGDVLVRLFGVSGADDGPTERTAHSVLAKGFDALFQGQNTLAAFWGKEAVRDDVNGGDKSFNVWNPPGNDAQRKEFFSEGGINGREYQFYDSDARTFQMSFKDMILARWEKTEDNPDGVITFADDQARAAFIEFTKNHALRGEDLGVGFSQALMSKGQIAFDSDADRAAFDDFTNALAQRAHSKGLDSRYVAIEIRKYVDRHDEVSFSGADELDKAVWIFQDARTPDEFADKAMAFAQWYPKNAIKITTPEIVSRVAPTAMNRKTVDAPPPEPTKQAFNEAASGRLREDVLVVNASNDSLIAKQFSDAASGILDRSPPPPPVVPSSSPPPFSPGSMA